MSQVNGKPSALEVLLIERLKHESEKSALTAASGQVRADSFKRAIQIVRETFAEVR